MGKKVLDTDEAGSCVYDLRIPLMALAQQCNNKYRKSYVRIPHALDFCFEEIKEGLIDLGSSIDDTDCHLTAFCKLMDEDKRIWSITLMVSNEFKDYRLKEYEKFIFQPHLKVTIDEKDDVSFLIGTR